MRAVLSYAKWISTARIAESVANMLSFAVNWLVMDFVFKSYLSEWHVFHVHFFNQIWNDFLVIELIFVFYHSVAPGFPDSRTSLLHQKLQMLNICMERRHIRDGGLPFSMTDRGAGLGHDDSEDEFFDCPEEEAQG